VSHRAQVDAAARRVLETHGNDESANTKYAELVSDPDELKEIYNQMITKETDKFISEYQFLNNQSFQQQQTLDLVNSVKDNVGSVKDDMEYSVGTFNKQISDIRNQININRKTQAIAMDYGKWLNTGLNIILVLALLFLIFTVGRRAFRSPSLPSNPASPPNPGDGADSLAAAIRSLTASKSPG
jgi:large-conductance mechanosensitive channel